MIGFGLGIRYGDGTVICGPTGTGTAGGVGVVVTGAAYGLAPGVTVEDDVAAAEDDAAAAAVIPAVLAAAVAIVAAVATDAFAVAKATSPNIDLLASHSRCVAVSGSENGFIALHISSAALCCAAAVAFAAGDAFGGAFGATFPTACLATASTVVM